MTCSSSFSTCRKYRLFMNSSWPFGSNWWTIAATLSTLRMASDGWTMTWQYSWRCLIRRSKMFSAISRFSSFSHTRVNPELANPFQRTTRSALYGFPGESLLTSTKWTKFETMKKIATHVLYRLWLFKHRHGMTWGSFFTRDLKQLLRDCRRRYLEAILEHFAVLKGDCYMRICLLWKKIWFL